MRFSNNEVLALLKRAFSSAGWSHGCPEEAAFAAWWLQAHGVPWLDNLPERWWRIDQAATSKTELIDNRAANTVLDARGASLLHCGANSIDLLYANACSEALATIEIRRCVDRMLILSSLVVMARRGANAIARWFSNESLHFASISAGRAFPEYIRYGASTAPESRTSLYVACSRSKSGLDHYSRNKTRLDEACPVIDSMSAEQYGREAERSRSRGIAVNAAAISLLNTAADRLLVRENEPE